MNGNRHLWAWGMLVLLAGCTVLFDDAAPSGTASRDAASVTDAAAAPEDAAPAPWGSRPGVLFVTSNEIRGDFASAAPDNGGAASSLSEADRLCTKAAEKNRKLDGRFFRAYLSAGGELPGPRLKSNPLGWVDTAGNSVGGGVNRKSADVAWSNPLNELRSFFGPVSPQSIDSEAVRFDELGNRLPTFSVVDMSVAAALGPIVWTGLVVEGQASNDNCSDWRLTETPAHVGIQGTFVSTSFRHWGARPCALSAHLLCVEVDRATAAP